LREVHRHSHAVSIADWCAWASGNEFGRAVTRRLRDLGIHNGDRLLTEAAAEGGWMPFARLDATTRFVAALVAAGGVKKGRPASRMLDALLKNDVRRAPKDPPVIPQWYWSVVSCGPDTDQLLTHGAVLVRVRGRRAEVSSPTAESGLSPELTAAITQGEDQTLRRLGEILDGEGRVFAVVLAASLLIAALGAVVEPLLTRSLIDLGRLLRPPIQRFSAGLLMVAVAAVLLLVELGVLGRLLRLGRRLELGLRMAFLEKLPRLHDRYFHSRPISDMAERGHSIYAVRNLPPLIGRLARAVLTLAAVGAALAFFAPSLSWLAALTVIVALVFPAVSAGLLKEASLRVQTHAGALSRFYLDAMLGLTAVRAHGAERAIRGEHEALLVDWVKASQRFLLGSVATSAAQGTALAALAGVMLLGQVVRGEDVGGVLLLAYWVLSLPNTGAEIVSLTNLLPLYRNRALRLLEPLGAPEEPIEGAPALPSTNVRGVNLTLDGVTVRAAGHTILQAIELDIRAGTHVAVVGASGAGKSSLLGLFLGWHRPAQGAVLVDGEPLSAGRLDRLREETAWVDPAVQIWNRSLLDNLLYGAEGNAERQPLADALEGADLYEVLRGLPDGLQTVLGEGGGLVSGGQGQRVRLGRAWRRSNARLVLLDEPFRGLDREQRRQRLALCRAHWAGATLLCVSHDVAETLDFDRVLVFAEGRLIEDSSPAKLADDRNSHYRALLEAEESVREELWNHPAWQRWRLAEGQLTTSTGKGEPEVLAPEGTPLHRSSSTCSNRLAPKFDAVGSPAPGNGRAPS
jgi:ATP-binding cassette subfamily B protein